MVGEIVGSRIVAVHIDLLTCGGIHAQITHTILVVIHLPREILMEIGAEIRTCTHTPARRDGKSDGKREGHAPHVGVGDIGTGEVTGQGVAVHGEGHTIVFHIGLGVKAFVEEVPSQVESPPAVEHLVSIHTYGGSSLRLEGIDTAHLWRQRQRTGASYGVTGTNDEPHLSILIGGSPLSPTVTLGLYCKGTHAQNCGQQKS